MTVPSTTTIPTQASDPSRAMPRVESGPLGALGEMLRDQFGALHRWQRDYGGVFELRVGPASFVIAADVDAASEMLIDGGQRFVRGGAIYEPMAAVFGTQSMVTSEGEIWRTRRRSAQPRFRQQAIAALSDRINQTVLDLLDELGPGDHDFYRFSGRISMSVALSVMFGHGLSAPGFAELGVAIDYAVKHIAISWVTNQLPRWLPIPGRRRFRRELAVIDATVHRLASERLATGDYGDDLLGMLLHMADNGDLAPEHLRNEAVALIIAGYETTANVLGWSFWELAKNPDIRARVQAEADTVLAQGTPQNPKQLAYTRQVFCEALRMYPSALWLPRNAADDTSLQGYSIAAGTSVLCSPYLVQRDSREWDEPDRFDPERFADGSNQPRNSHAFMPFGLGQHMCIGQHLSMLEGTLAVARVLKRWNIEPIPGREPIMTISTTMNAKHGIWLRVTPR